MKIGEASDGTRTTGKTGNLKFDGWKSRHMLNFHGKTARLVVGDRVLALTCHLTVTPEVV